MKTVEELFRERVNPDEIGNPQRRRELRALYQQNQRQQMAEVQANFEANLSQGMSAGEAATTQFSPTNTPTPPPTQYTWHDGDTLQSVAAQYNIDPQRFINANPDASSFQTGQVLKLPPPIQNQQPVTIPKWIEALRPVFGPGQIADRALTEVFSYADYRAPVSGWNLMPITAQAWRAWNWWTRDRQKLLGRSDISGSGWFGGE